jgi:hypothetical protein
VRGTKKALLGSVAAAVLVMGLPMTSASADAGDAISGGCSFNTDANQTATQGQNNGAIEVTAFMQTSAKTPDAGASVDCKIQVNGVDAPGTEIDVAANAVGLVQGQAQISFDDQGGTLPSALCEKDNWGDGDTSGWVCQGSTEIQIPPQQVIDALDGLFATLDQLEIDNVDPVVCPVLKTIGAAIGGGVPGVLEIRADGDVYVADPLALGLNPVWDCPPYGNF